MGNDQGSVFKAPEDELQNKALLREALATGSSATFVNALRDIEEDWKRREFKKMDSMFATKSAGNPSHVDLVRLTITYLTTPIYPNEDMAVRVREVNPDDLPKDKLLKEYRSPLQWSLDMDHVQLANAIRQRISAEEKRQELIKNDKVDEGAEGGAEAVLDRSALAKQRLQAAKEKSAVTASGTSSSRPVQNSANMMSDEEKRQLAAMMEKYKH